MVETAKKFTEISRNIETNLLKEFVISGEFGKAKESEIILIRQMVDLLNVSLEYNEKLAETIVAMNEKLDKLMLI